MEKKNKTVDMISSFLKRGKQQQAPNTRMNSKGEDDQWIFMLENQIDEKRDKEEQLATLLIVVGIVLLYVNYFPVLLVIGNPFVSRFVNLCCALAIIVIGLIMLDPKGLENQTLKH
ncbi:hypothetical protein A4A49_28342 [Nicotiana attenuata]|uniref:Uncharacterized protein n=1 Tax=Nicotiana attenuata TaxID=49451 RepID=A0A1J6J1X3_NICAT|nr:hypothetical protein A4A49_28342 [Nicotiana attenuata]